MAAAATVGEPLVDALHELQRDGVRIIFSSQIVPSSLRVIAPPSGATDAERLRSLLLPNGLDARPVPGGGWVVVEIRRVAGTLEVVVTSATDGSALRGASVAVLEARRMARTDRLGRARISDIPVAAYTVAIRADGFRSQTILWTPTQASAHETLPVRLVPSEAPLAEVVVQTSRYGIDTLSLGTRMDRSRADLDATPGTDEDLARALQQLPGTAGGGFSARTHVRGSGDDETLFRFDGVTLVDPYHLKDFQSLFSAIDPANTESTEFWTGAFPIRFGERTGAVVDIAPRNSATRTAEAGLSLLNSSLLIGTPFAHDRGTILVSGRISNLSHVAQWLDRDIGEPEFQDLLVRATWDFADHTTLAAGLLGLEDSIDVFSQSRSQQARADYQDSYAWLRLRHEFAGNLTSDTLLSRTSQRDARAGTLTRAAIATGDLREEMHSYFETAREEISWMPQAGWFLRAGAEIVRNAADHDFAATTQYQAPFYPDLIATPIITRSIEVPLKGWTDALYASARWQPAAGTTAELGIRRDGQMLDPGASGAQWNVRANLRRRLTAATALRLSWGQFAQAPWVNELDVADGQTQLAPVVRVIETNLSIEHLFDGGWSLRAEGYDKRQHSPLYYFENLFSPLVLLPEIEVDRTRVTASGARMSGVELTLASDRSRAISGWLSYAWSRAVDRIAGADIPRSWDQRHTVQAGVLWSTGRWQLSGIFNWHSGWPYTRLTASTLAWTDPANVALTLGPRNAARHPDFTSVELRATYVWQLKTGSLQAEFELRNAFDDKNACCRSYSVTTAQDGTATLNAQTDNWLGITPLIGLRWRY